MTLLVLSIISIIILASLSYRAHKRSVLNTFVADTLLVSIAVAFLTSAIFFYFSVYLPNRANAQRINLFAKKQCEYLVADCSHMLTFLARQAESTADLSNITSNELFAIAARVNPHAEAPISIMEGGKGYNRDYIAHVRRESRKTIDVIIPYSYAIDSALVMHILELIDNDLFTDRFANGLFFQNMSMFGGNKDLSHAAPALWSYIQSIQKIDQYWKNR